MRANRFGPWLSVFLLVGLGSILTAPARAQDYCGSGYGPYFGLGFGGYGGRSSPYALGQIPVPPYFALHPPVYYSAPVARPYGYSPFAYPGYTPTPEPVVDPQVIDNPYCAPTSAVPNGSVPNGSSGTAEEETSAAAKPKLILNPFLVKSPAEAVVELAKIAK